MPSAYNSILQFSRLVMKPGMRLENVGPDRHTVYCPANASSPWLYEVAEAEGYATFFGEEFCYTGSPWVVQENIFPMKADIELHKVFCRMAKHLKPQLEDNKLFKAGYGSYCIDRFEGIPKQEIALNVLEQMWEEYREEPKFAYLNGMAAHNYITETEKLAWRAEEYDEALTKFLKTILSRDDRDETVIIIRSDHGLQGGDSSVVDYSTQTEHRHPWTEIIIPDRYPVKTLIANSNQVVTPFDMYAMLRRLMTGKIDRNRIDGSYDLLREFIPPRTCKFAKIPRDFCMAEYTPPPAFGTCNMFEEKQAVFCSDPKLGSSKVSLGTPGRTMGKRFTYSPTSQPPAQGIKRNETSLTSSKHNPHLALRKKMKDTADISCNDKAELLSSAANEILSHQWSILDSIVERYSTGGVKVSGGKS